MSLQQNVEDFLRYLLMEKGSSKNTVAAYRQDLNKFIEYFNVDNKNFRQISAKDLENFIVFLATQNPPASSASLNRMRSSIRSLNKYLINKGQSDFDVTRKLSVPKLSKKLPNVLDIDKVAKLLDAPSPYTSSGIRDRAFLELLYASGARVSEIVNLDIDDIDFDKRLIIVTGKGDKQRIVPFGSFANEALKQYLSTVRPVYATKTKQAARVFLGARGVALSRQSAWLIIKAAAAKANIFENISPHTLRHSCATHMLQGGADIRTVQEILGHVSIATTQLYTHITINNLQEMFLTTHPRAGNS